MRSGDIVASVFGCFDMVAGNSVPSVIRQKKENNKTPPFFPTRQFRRFGICWVMSSRVTFCIGEVRCKDES